MAKQPSVAHPKHLATLQRDGLVTAHRSGREVRDAVRPERPDQARARMAQIATRWDTRLAGIDAVIRRR